MAFRHVDVTSIFDGYCFAMFNKPEKYATKLNKMIYNHLKSLNPEPGKLIQTEHLVNFYTVGLHWYEKLKKGVYNRHMF